MTNFLIKKRVYNSDLTIIFSGTKKKSGSKLKTKEQQMDRGPVTKEIQLNFHNNYFLGSVSLPLVWRLDITRVM